MDGIIIIAPFALIFIQSIFLTCFIRKTNNRLFAIEDLLKQPQPLYYPTPAQVQPLPQPYQYYPGGHGNLNTV